MFAELARPAVMAVLLLAPVLEIIFERFARLRREKRAEVGRGWASFSRAPLKGINTAAPRAFYSPEFYYSGPSGRRLLAARRIHRDYE